MVCGVVIAAVLPVLVPLLHESPVAAMMHTDGVRTEGALAARTSVGRAGGDAIGDGAKAVGRVATDAGWWPRTSPRERVVEPSWVLGWGPLPGACAVAMMVVERQQRRSSAAAMRRPAISLCCPLSLPKSEEEERIGRRGLTSGSHPFFIFKLFFPYETAT